MYLDLGIIGFSSTFLPYSVVVDCPPLVAIEFFKKLELETSMTWHDCDTVSRPSSAASQYCKNVYQFEYAGNEEIHFALEFCGANPSLE
jgi:hypothetical protein